MPIVETQPVPMHHEPSVDNKEDHSGANFQSEEVETQPVEVHQEASINHFQYHSYVNIPSR